MKPILYIGQEVRVLYGFGNLQIFGIIIGAIENNILRILYHDVPTDDFVILRVSSHFVVPNTII